MEKELEEAKEEIERLKGNLDEKASIIRQLSSKNESQQDEAESLKALVSELQKKHSSEAEKDNQCNEGGGGDLLDELEDRRRKIEDELKWKVEQFKHLEEAHEKLRDHLRLSKSERETEKSALVGEISKLQERLDDGNRTAEDLKNQLSLFKQALENEESRRKRVEDQLSEMKSLMESSTNEGGGGGGGGGGFQGRDDECSAAEIDPEQVAANLRHSLRVKEMDYKDMEYKANKLEKENQELLTSIKELQEAHIPRAVPTPSSWTRLKGRLKSLEQSHKECSANLRTREAEWTSRADKLTQELAQCNSSLEMKDQIIESLRKELQGCNSSLTQLKMQNEEMSLMLQLMRSQGSEERETGLAHLMEQLEKEREGKLALQEELDKLKDELEEVRDALDMIDSEMTDKTNEKSEVEFELEGWKSIAAHLEMQVTGNQVMRRELELSLLAQAEVEEMLKLDMEEKDRRIGNLEQQIFLMDQEIRIEEEEEEEDTPLEEDVKVPPQPLQTDDEEQLQLELLAKELEEAIVEHIKEEQSYTFEQDLEEDVEPQSMVHLNRTRVDSSAGGEEVCVVSKENVNQQHLHLKKTEESFVEERSPFRELN